MRTIFPMKNSAFMLCGRPAVYRLGWFVPSFTNYNPASPEKEMALNKCQAFVQKGLERIKQGNGLFFQGPVPCWYREKEPSGSFFKAILENNTDIFGTPSSDNQICGESVYDGLCCFMISVVDLLNTLRDSFSTDNCRAPARRILDRARTDAIVILDDIGQKSLVNGWKNSSMP